MGGCGSGRQGRRKMTTGEARRVDIRDLKKRNLLRPGLYFSWGWTAKRFNVEEKTGEIGIRVCDDSLELEYTTMDANGNRRDYDYRTYFQYTPCNYGGRRLWLTCPTCGEKVAVLYLIDGLFICRICGNLNYASSQQASDILTRRGRKIVRLKKKLGEKDAAIIGPVPQRPRYMHHRTYNRLWLELLREEEKYWNGVAAKFPQLKA